MTKQDESNILHMAVKTYGSRMQTDMAIEEMAELMKALLKLRRYPDSQQARENILEEMADVSIMLDQLQILYGDYRFERHKKLERLLHRLMQQQDDKRDREKAIEEAGEKTLQLDERYVKYIKSLGILGPDKKCVNCIHRDKRSGRCLHPDSTRYTGIVDSEEICGEFEN